MRLFGKIAIWAFVVAAGGASCVSAQAVNLPVGESSFENPVLEEGIQGWPFVAVPSGGPGVDAYPNYPWVGEVLDAGLFYNPAPATDPINNATGHLDNMDGRQAAFIGGEVGNHFYQVLNADYEAGNSYTLRFGLAKSLFSAPRSSQASTAHVVAELHYLDDANARHLVTGASFFDDAATGLRNDHFKYVEFNTPELPSLHPAIGQPVVIVFSMGGTLGGHFDIDDVSVTAIPEPATLGLLTLAGLLSMRRRR